MWSIHPYYINVIKQSWNNVAVGCPMFILTHKLMILKENLRVWDKETFCDVHSQIKAANKKLDEIQE